MMMNNNNNHDTTSSATLIRRRRSSLLNIIPSMLLGGGSSSDLLSSSAVTTSNTTNNNSANNVSNQNPQAYNICVLGTRGVGKKSLVSYMINGYYNPSTFMNSIRQVGDEEELDDEASTWTANDDQSVLSERSSSFSSLHSFRKENDELRADYSKVIEVENGERNVKLNFFLLSHSFSDIRNRNMMDSDLEFVKTVARAHLVIMVYDVTELPSFESLVLYHEQLSKITSNLPSDETHADPLASFKFGSPQSPALLMTSPRTPRGGQQRKIMAVGVKTDLEDDRTVSESHILSHRNVIGSDIKFYECSSVTGENVLTFFEDVKELAKSIIRPKSVTANIETKQRRSSLVISSSRTNNSASSSTPNLENRRASLRLVDSFKNIGNKIRNRSNSISTSSPVINEKRRSQSIGLIISQHEQNTGYKISSLNSDLDNGSQKKQQTVNNNSKSFPPSSSEPPQSKEVRKRPNTLFNIFKRK
ncbi:predicted protein [Naegleria gruberi]|uniref:Predicted protein n=1 Tax=Naegleria gruberi TaxID=5762 RepID=D2W422_NAEGR|nr:uncharacterized protein NAEGRDRAFT_76152 [Naegleria gruberi]EFC36185.1 predicted protein [Naegleria gruberi]|eukprot:XP_002668929.1 predicted protein [Naegleria gruberi strain NEG-M]